MKKKLLAMMLMGTLIAASTAGCGTSEDGSDSEHVQEQAQSGDTQDNSQSTSGDEQSGENSENAIIIYFSWLGNTEAVAQEIQNQTGADIFKIEPQEPYTDDYDELLDIAQNEQQEEARPAIAETVGNIEDYDTVYFGYPNWWGDMPMIMYSFLDDYDLSGKVIAPFVTSGGSGFSGTLDTIQEMEPQAEVTEGLSLGSGEADDSADAVSQWLGEIGL